MSIKLKIQMMLVEALLDVLRGKKIAKYKVILLKYLFEKIKGELQNGKN